VKYIEEELKETVPLSTAVRETTFLTIENYVDMKELLWQRDYHNYIHEGCRVDLSGLLNMHTQSSARLREICHSKYKASYYLIKKLNLFSLLTV
jgi:hypothetical protein